MKITALFSSLFISLSLVAPPAMAANWQPTKPVEIIIPAGPGGGADQMARLIQEIVAKHKLMPQPIVVANKPGKSGAEGFLYVKGNSGNTHLLIVTLSNLFTTPLATGADFNWRDMTPVSMMALDQFVLWVNADTPYRTAKDYLEAVRASPGTFKMGGTGSQQEDEIVTRALESQSHIKFKYVPLKGGGDVAKALGNKEVDSTVNNPIEALALWREGKVRPLGVFDLSPMEYKERVAGNAAWSDIPTMRNQGYNVTYVMLRGIFAAPGIPPEVREYYLDVMYRVTQTPEWKDYLTKGALKNKFVTGSIFNSWLTYAEIIHKTLMSAQ